ncbi:hypothetical protein KTD31_03475 [Burkholderia multivorans]|jgi:hypothetical protein|uniref:hypothetical protein n=1 Tax=Burkholderia multivorans TaxID=87883 RepID=UPI001C25028B|nr:hypothetical protein [Burkholderia multivorans]MBU9200414.1 hypothetical protein [Burkholderia multivorans]MDN8078461.1 hypothetical protein [Burkholderia multivorans]
MTDIVQAREAAIAAETKVENMFNRVLDRLHALNSRLMELHDAIKAAQPVASGAVCLELYPCGPGCTGCPHPRWVQYNWTQGTTDKPGVLMGTNLDAQDRDPILALKRKASHYKPTAELIREAKSILTERTQLLTSVRALRYVAKAS